VLLVDTGPLVAAVDPRDRWHRVCAEYLASTIHPLLVPELVLTEVAQLVAARVGPRAEVVVSRSVDRGEIRPVATERDDWTRITALAAKYDDLPLGIVDAAVVALAERLGIITVATLDRKHFSVVRPLHVDAFELVP
jgi:predicted nucleic acid-binding protein